MLPGGKPIQVLESVEPLSHCLSWCIHESWGTDPLDEAYLTRLKQLVQRYQLMWVSDHLCWTRYGGHYFHDLLPLPYTEEAVEHIANRISAVQDLLQQRILLENVSCYLEFKHNTLSEPEFLAAVAERADCLILLDINNIVVNANNHGYDAYQYLSYIPAHRVRQYHLAGHSRQGKLAIDTHNQSSPSKVRDLYRRAVDRFGSAATLLERDDAIPSMDELLKELEEIRRTTINSLEIKKFA